MNKYGSDIDEYGGHSGTLEWEAGCAGVQVQTEWEKGLLQGHEKD